MFRPRLIAIVVPGRRKPLGKVRTDGQMITFHPFCFRDSNNRPLQTGKGKRN